MKKTLKTLLCSAVFALTMSSAALAGDWQQNADGWWWAEDDGSYPRNTWLWLDGNQDGISECYYFDSNGYLAVNTIIDGWQVDGNGCWVQNGQVQFTEQSSNRQQAMELLKTYNSYSSAQTDTDADYLMNMTMDIDGSSINMNMNGIIKMKNVTDSNLQYLMDCNLSVLGESMYINTFYTDNYLYINVDGEKVKMYMPLSAAMETASQMNLTSVEDMAYIQDASMVTNADGSTTVYFTVNSSEMNALMDSMMGAMTSISPTSDTSGSLNNYKGEVTFSPAGIPVQEKALMDFSETVQGTAFGFEIYMELNYNNPGQPVSFTLPSTEGYVDFSQM